MGFLRRLLGIIFLGSLALASPHSDPCSVLSGKKWASPSQVRACITSFPVDPLVKANTIEVLNKTLAFHTSVNYQIQAPEPFRDIHEDLLADLARINRTEYSSEFDLHVELFRAFKRVNDGHCAYINYCYDSLYVTYLPTPLVLLTDRDGLQHVHIAPEAYAIASAEFSSEIDFWQKALPKGMNLTELSGARVLLINGQDPFSEVNKNALVTGSYQSFGTRQNSFFSSYSIASEGWTYSMGNFAQRTWPDVDNVTLTLQLEAGSPKVDIIVLPYRSRLSSRANGFTNSSTYRSSNCVASKRTNGDDAYSTDFLASLSSDAPPPPIAYAQQQPLLNPLEARQHALNVLLDSTPLSDIELPMHLHPRVSPIVIGNSTSTGEGEGPWRFYLMRDNVTGVLALGSFSAKSFSKMQKALLDGLVGLRERGARRLIVDVSNNGGGYICIAHWLHRIIIGPRDSTVPQAGLDTTARAGPLARLIVKQIAKHGVDPDERLLYNSVQWRNASHEPFEKGVNWMGKGKKGKGKKGEKGGGGGGGKGGRGRGGGRVKKVVNGREDVFSQRLGQECQPFDMTPPAEGLFEPKDIVIVSNGRCASSCSLFSITMSKLEGVKTIVVGGKSDTPQQYCGTVGGQSTDFSTIDTEIKTAKLKNHTLAPPDFLSNSVQGITWRLGYGIDDPAEPEEWQDHPADVNLLLDMETVNAPERIWGEVVRNVWKDTDTDTDTDTDHDVDGDIGGPGTSAMFVVQG